MSNHSLVNGKTTGNSQNRSHGFSLHFKPVPVFQETALLFWPMSQSGGWGSTVTDNVYIAPANTELQLADWQSSSSTWVWTRSCAPRFRSQIFSKHGYVMQVNQSYRKYHNGTQTRLRHFTGTKHLCTPTYPYLRIMTPEPIMKTLVKYLAADPQWTSSHLDLCAEEDRRCILSEIKPRFDSLFVWYAPATQGPLTMTPPSPSPSRPLSLLSCHSEIFWLVAKMIVAIPRHSLLLCAVSQGCCYGAWCLWSLKDIQNNHKSDAVSRYGCIC